MKNKSIIIILVVVLVLVGLGLIILMANLLGGSINFGFGGVSDELVMDEFIDGDYSNISISTDMSEIMIKNSSDDRFRVVVYGYKERTSFDKSNNELNIKTKAKSCFGFCFNQKASKVIVYVPSSYNKEMNVDNRYGDIEIEKFMDSKMTIVAKAGDVRIDGGREIDIKNDFGNIKIDNVRTLRAKASCGNIKVGEAEYVDIKNDYGDIDVDSVTNYLNIEESCGDIEIGSIDLKNNSRIKNSLGNINIGSTNEVYIDAKVDLGESKINNNYREAKVELEVENNCGNITVDN